MAAISYFIEKHVWLTDTGLIADGRNPYGISELENVAMTAVTRSLKHELEALQVDAPNYQKADRGKEYFELRKAILLAARTRLSQAVMASNWPKAEFQLNEISTKLLGTPIASSESVELDARLALSPTVLWSVVDLAFYSGGFGGRSDSWAEGPEALNWCSQVEGVKGLLNGAVFDGPRNASACNGGRAWAGWTRPNPSRGEYKHEGLHRFGNSSTGTFYPPMPGWPPIGPCPLGDMSYYCDSSNGYLAVWSPIDLKLSVAAPMEVNKPGHHLVLKNCSSPVIVTATFVPPVPSYNTPPTITWTGGTIGSDNLHRSVACADPGNVSVTARVGTNLSATVQVHVIDGSPPQAGSQATLNWQNIGSFPLSGAFGEVAVQIGHQGVIAPTYDVSAGFSTDRWVFQLNSVTHGYKMGISSMGRQDLPYGNPRPFPISPLLPPGSSIVTAHIEARKDLDTAGLVPGGAIALGPRRQYYWVEWITQAHEQAHINQFYQPQEAVK